MDAGGRSGTAVVVLLGGDGVEVVVGRIPGRRPNLAVVEALARLHLEARRRGCSIRVRDPSRELCELLELVGLGVLVARPRDLRVEVGRKAEGGEQLRVEEAVEPGDAPV